MLPAALSKKSTKPGYLFAIKHKINNGLAHVNFYCFVIA